MFKKTADLVNEGTPEALDPLRMSQVQCPAFHGISFRDGTGRDFCKIPGSRDFPGRDLPHIFIPGFFGNCSGFFGIFLFDTIGDQFKHFSRAGKPNKHFFHQKNRPANCRRDDLQRFAHAL